MLSAEKSDRMKNGKVRVRECVPVAGEFGARSKQNGEVVLSCRTFRTLPEDDWVALTKKAVGVLKREAQKIGVKNGLEEGRDDGLHEPNSGIKIDV